MRDEGWGMSPACSPSLLTFHRLFCIIINIYFQLGRRSDAPDAVFSMRGFLCVKVKMLF